MLGPLELFVTKLFHMQTLHNFNIKIIAKLVEVPNKNEVMNFFLNKSLSPIYSLLYKNGNNSKFNGRT